MAKMKRIKSGGPVVPGSSPVPAATNRPAVGTPPITAGLPGKGRGKGNGSGGLGKGRMGRGGMGGGGMCGGYC